MAEDAFVGGFRFAGEIVGIKKGSKKDRPDLGLIVAERPAIAAGVFTKNRMRAAPVELSQKRLRAGLCQAIVVNSGNANACSGAQGLADAREMAALAAVELGIDPKLVCVASTGVIGEPLPMAVIRDGVPRAVKTVTEDGFAKFARAILTTDKGPKTSFRRVDLGGGQVVTLAGCAKGAGMIAPNMATTLGFIVTDAPVEHAWLKQALAEAVGATFNAVSVDGDTSTNDSVFVLASGAAGGKPVRSDKRRGRALADALREVMGELAVALVRDGEGATKVVEIRVEGAASERDARRVARRICESPLVKTAIHGADPNWGRVLAAVGNAGIEVSPTKVDLDIGEVPVVRAGIGVRGADTEEKAHAVMKEAAYRMRVHLHAGRASAVMWTCDLTHEYIKINADYRS